MFRILAVFFTFSGVIAGYTDGSDNNNLNKVDGASNSYGYGYSGSFSGADGQFPHPGVPQFDFEGFLHNYLETLNKYHQDFVKKGEGIVSYAYTSSSSNGNVKASSNLSFNKNNNGIQAAAQGSGTPGAAAFSSGSGTGGGFGGSFAGPSAGFGGPNVGLPSGFSGGHTYGGAGPAPNVFTRGGFGGDDGGAYAAATIGRDGVQQTAAVYPENPNAPNINTHYSGSGQPGGFRSVFTSSSSHTSNINGKPQTVQQASTTVNDNGKITTYNVKNP